jgi:hypothetical protein
MSVRLARGHHLEVPFAALHHRLKPVNLDQALLPEDHRFAPVAQLDRATDYESVGRRFESFRAHHVKANINNNLNPKQLESLN